MRNNERKTLHLVLKREFYEQIDEGVKTTEYRASKPYWDARLKNGYDCVEFRLGCNRDAKRMTFYINEIDIIDTPNIHKELLKTSKCYAIRLGGRVK